MIHIKMYPLIHFSIYGEHNRANFNFINVYFVLVSACNLFSQYSIIFSVVAAVINLLEYDTETLPENTLS